MATTYSFDVVSGYDKSEITNVLDQVKREIDNRYDFKNTPAAIEWLNGDHTGFKLTGDSDFQLDTILDIVRKKLAGRGISQKILDTTKPIHEANLRSTQEVPFIKGLDHAKAKEVTSLIRESLPKLKPQIQGDAVRVTGSNKDDLQAAIKVLQETELPYPLQFNNFR